MQPILTIMIPTLVSRAKFYDRIYRELSFQLDQLGTNEVQILPYLDNGEVSTGLKRNWCIHNAAGQYVAFVDDDDMITDCYIRSQLHVAKSGADCGNLKGLYFMNGVYDRPFLHSIQYDHWYQDNQFYYRNPNHLNCIKKELILDIPYVDQYVGEDGKWSEAIHASGRLKNETHMRETLYLYYDVTKTKPLTV